MHHNAAITMYMNITNQYQPDSTLDSMEDTGGRCRLVGTFENHQRLLPTWTRGVIPRIYRPGPASTESSSN